jgi:hypothetical protein
VHHDSDKFDLKIRAGRHTGVIHTTRNHLFWNLTRDKWVKAAALRHGDHLRTSGTAAVTVTGGYVPAHTAGWMWDLTIPGNNDHDFYIWARMAAVLVHNVGCDEWADKFQKRNGGDINTFESPLGRDSGFLGPYRPAGPGTPAVPEDWGYHTVVVNDGTVFDQWHPGGLASMILSRCLTTATLSTLDSRCPSHSGTFFRFSSECSACMCRTRRFSRHVHSSPDIGGGAATSHSMAFAIGLCRGVMVDPNWVGRGLFYVRYMHMTGFPMSGILRISRTKWQFECSLNCSASILTPSRWGLIR